MFGIYSIVFINQKGQRVTKEYTNYLEYKKTLIRMNYSKEIKVVAYGQA